MELQTTLNYEHFDYEPGHFGVSNKIQKIALDLAEMAINFSEVKRVPRYTPETRESDVEHSFMLGFVAMTVAEEHFPELDSGLIAKFAYIHDLVELITGDVATFAISQAELKNKEEREKAALSILTNMLPPSAALLLEVYEEQTVPEARFIRLMDKLMPVLVDILGPGSQVMHEDYTTFTGDQLEEAEILMSKRFETMFPDPFLKPLHLARTGLANTFRNRFKEVPIQDTLF